MKSWLLCLVLLFYLDSRSQNIAGVENFLLASQQDQEILVQEYFNPLFNALVPFEKYWRTGANAATTFETSNGVSFNGQKLEPGKYRLYTVPGKDEWKIVLNSEGDKFFAISEPDYSKDVLTTSVKPEIKPKNIVEQFTIRFAKSEKGVEMNLVWDTTVLTIPID